MIFHKQAFKVMIAAFCCLGLAAMAVGDEEGKGKGKGKAEVAPAATPAVIQIDVSKLPPDLAKALLKYASAPPAGKPGAKAGDAPSKGKAPAAKGKSAEAPSKGKAPAAKAPAAKAAEAPSKGKAPAGKGKAPANPTEAPSKGKAPAGKGAPMAKGKTPASAAKGYASGKQLPPGLANKPANHPGRTHYIEHVLGGKVGGPTGKAAPGKPAPAKPGKGKKSQEEEE
jgi:hypothetical protein